MTKCFCIRPGMLFWHAIAAFYLIAYLLTFFPAFYIWHIFGDSLWLRSGRDRFDPQPELAVRVRGGTLRSRVCSMELACSWGPAGIALPQRLLFSSGTEHCDPALAVDVRGGSLWSWACRSGPAGVTLILSLLFGSGGEPCDLALAVEARRRRRKEEEGPLT